MRPAPREAEGCWDGCSLSRAEADDTSPIPTHGRPILGLPQADHKSSSEASGTARKPNDDLKRWLEQMLERHQTALQTMLLNHQQAFAQYNRSAPRESVMDPSQSEFAVGKSWQMPLAPAVESKANEAGRNPVTKSVTLEPARPSEDSTVQPGESRLLGESSINVDGEGSPSSLKGRSHKFTTVIKETLDDRIEAIVKSIYFDYVMGVIICGNMLCMFVQLEWEGYQGSVYLGLEPVDDTAWPGADAAFAFFEEVFTIIYLLEFIIRVYYFRLAYFRDAANILDALVVLSSTVDAYVLRFTQDENDSSDAGKLIKVCRVVRILKIVRMLTKFAELRVLMRACAESASAFFWSMLLAMVVIVAGAIFMAQLATSFINDPRYPEELRFWLHQYYGSCSKATYTMFEITFSGGWPGRTRETVEEIHWLFSIFWILYVMLIHFALTRLVAAMFLKQTMAVATADKEKSVMEKMKVLTITLRDFFIEADTSKDGFLSSLELDTALGYPNVKKMLEDLDISIPDLRHLFELLADAEGKVDMTSFVQGALRLKGSLRATDAISLAHEQRKLQRGIILLGEGLEQLFSHLDADVQWRFKRPDRAPRITHMQAMEQ